MCIDRAIVEIVIIADDIFHEGFAFDDSFHISDDIFEDRELCLRELHLLTRERSYMVLRIDFYISEAEIFSIFDFFFPFLPLVQSIFHTCLLNMTRPHVQSWPP